MAIRSGRFKFTFTAATKEICIVKSEKTVAFYRIFNSGEAKFDVDIGSSATPLDSTFSLDVAVKGEARVKGNERDEVEGIYEYLDNQIVGQSIRSGRFKIEESSNAPHKIIDLAHQPSGDYAYYRIFNSDDETFEIWKGKPGDPNSEKLSDVESKRSYDFEIQSKKDIWVRKATGSTKIRGIYDFLGVRK